MTERLGMLVLAWLLALPASTGAQANSTPYLEAAGELSEWLIATTDQGQRWPVAVLPGGGLQQGSASGLAAGPAGVGLFFLGLHAQTGELRHLQMAVAAAARERQVQLARGSGNPDFLDGAAGSGLFYLAMHAGTGDARYLDWAEDYAAALEQAAIEPVAGQRYWRISPDWPRIYTGIPHGAAGIALFQLSLYLRNGDPALLRSAEDAYRWIRENHALPLGAGDAIGFRRLTTDSDVYNWWSGATAGIIPLQLMLHGVTGEQRYLDDLRRAADGLATIGDPALPGTNWTYGTDHASGYRPLVFAHGNASIPPALLLAHQALGQASHQATAQRSLEWILAMAGRADGLPGVYWIHGLGSRFADIVITSGMIGTASVGWMLARTAPLEDDPRLDALAAGSADHLVSLSETPAPGQRRWINYLGPPSDWDPKLYELGWWTGNAGVGLALLAAHQRALGERPALEVHAF